MEPVMEAAVETSMETTMASESTVAAASSRDYRSIDEDRGEHDRDTGQ
jgi:hypothetical protein